MRGSWVAAAERITERIARTPTQAAAVWAQHRVRLRVLAISSFVLVLCVTGVATVRRAGRAFTVANSDSTWQFLLVCTKCGYRERTTDHPGQTLQQQGGLFQCPGCGQYAAAWYRRGGLTIPPGGWSTSRPAAGRAASAPTDEGGGAP